MLLPEQALDIVLNRKISCRKEEISLSDSLNRVLAEDVLSEIELPPFDKAAMDGFAYCPEEGVTRYLIVECIAAGEVPEKTLSSGECSRIMTGAMVPRGATHVIRVEFTTEDNGYMHVTEPDEYVNIARAGENLKTGQRVLEKGTLIRPQEIATLASIGKDRVSVSARPLIGIINTGTEIVEPGSKTRPGQIYNSNGPQLCAQVKSLQVGCRYYGIVHDDMDSIREVIGKAFEECDFILLSGGVSMGDFDFVPGLLKEAGVKLHFEKIAIKPGKPTVFGEKEGRFFFGLPGNPVSTFVIFEYFVKPLIYAAMGHCYVPQTARGYTDRDFHRLNSQRVEFVPVHFSGTRIMLPDYKGSGHINALTQANALIRVDQGVHDLIKGTEVDVRLL